MITRHLIAALLAFTAVVYAGTGADKHFTAMDSDGDGRITRTEHAAGAKKMFTAADANRDNVLTSAEMDVAAAKHGGTQAADDKTSAEKIAVLDQNGDGRLTAAEHDAGIERMFARMDRDGDGALSRAECAEGLKAMKKDQPAKPASSASR